MIYLLLRLREADMRLAWVLRGLILFSALSMFLLLLEEDTGKETARLFEKAFRGAKTKTKPRVKDHVPKEDQIPDWSDPGSTLEHDVIQTSQPQEDTPLSLEEEEGGSKTLGEDVAEGSTQEEAGSTIEKVDGDLEISFQLERPDLLSRCSEAVFQLLPLQARPTFDELRRCDYYLNMQCTAEEVKDDNWNTESVRFARKIPFMVDSDKLWYARLFQCC